MQNTATTVSVPHPAAWQKVTPDEMTTRVFDAIVVGAGPAGSSAAFTLAHRGANVLLLEKMHFPRFKACGDGVVYYSLPELANMGLLGAMKKLFQPITHVRAWQGDMELSLVDAQSTEQGHSSTIGYVAPRELFDTILAFRAIMAGALWRDQCLVEQIVAIQSDRIILRGRCTDIPVTLQARLLVIADGAGSRLGRQAYRLQLAQGVHDALLAPEIPASRITAIRGYAMGIEQLAERLEFYFGRHPALWYHWVFPVRKEQKLANVGVGAATLQWRNLVSTLSPQRALTDFLDVYAPGWQWKQFPQAAPICSGMRGESVLYGERLLCVGEAASLVDPQTGEGISGALFSGRLAGEIGAEALKHDKLSAADLAPYATAIRTRYQSYYEKALSRVRELLKIQQESFL